MSTNSGGDTKPKLLKLGAVVKPFRVALCPFEAVAGTSAGASALFSLLLFLGRPIVFCGEYIHSIFSP